MNDNRRPMSDADRSKRIALHMVVGMISQDQIDAHVDALKEEIAIHTREMVNVGWVQYGEVQAAVIRECMRMPKKVRDENCFSERLGKPHLHIRVHQMFDRPFQVVQA